MFTHGSSRSEFSLAYATSPTNMWPIGSATSLMALQDSSCWLIFRSAQTIRISQKFLPRLPSRSVIHYSTRTRRSVFHFRRRLHPGSRYEAKDQRGIKDGRMNSVSLKLGAFCFLRLFAYLLILLPSIAGLACGLKA